jgi:osmotically-inducible protein OsmY
MSDMQLQQDIIDELEFDPAIHATHIGISVADGVVTLSGYVDTFSQKTTVEAAVKRVRGVRAVAQEIEVRLPGHKMVADDEIAARALDIIAWDTAVPDNKIGVKVERGWVTLGGEVDWHFQRMLAETAVRKLGGITGVTNLIAVVPSSTAANIRERIAAALKRNADLDADQVKVTVSGATVTLDGNVMNWRDRDVIENAAWSSPGVQKVDNRLAIGGLGRAV